MYLEWRVMQNVSIIAVVLLSLCVCSSTQSNELNEVPATRRNIAETIRTRYEHSKPAFGKASAVIKLSLLASGTQSRKGIAQAVGKTRYYAKRASFAVDKFYQRQNIDEKKHYLKNKMTEWIELNGEILTAAQSRIQSQYTSQILENTQNVDDTESAYRAITAALTVYSQIQDEIKTAAHRNVSFSINACMDFPVQTDFGTVSFKELNRRRFSRLFPYLVGTDITEYPAAILTAVIMHDKSYYFHRLKIVRTQDGVKSISDVIRNPNYYAGKTLVDSIKLANLLERLKYSNTSGKVNLEDVTELVGAFKAVNE